MNKPLDVLIIGAGISGIAMGCELASRENIRFEILDKRQRVGGTWDIFTYPGVRSDSEMDSYRFSFAPWRGTRPLGKGPEIRDYLEEVARSHDLLKKIRFGTQATTARWDSEDALWTVTTNKGDVRARHLHIAGGYFNHERGYIPDFPGKEDFQGVFVEPQHWPTDLDCAGKKVIVIGSGATAATLIPELADTVSVTMLQRSPSHMAALPNHAFGGPDTLQRWRAIVQNQLIVALAERAPRLLNLGLAAGRARILPKELRHHFQPDYPVWDQRVCRIPDGDLFHLIAEGEVEVVTDGVEKLTPTGLCTTSGRELDADIIVSATGLQLQALGGLTLEVDGRVVKLGDTPAYRGCLLFDVPNCSFTMGYVNESFTMRAELVAEFVARVIDIARQGSGVVRPVGTPANERVSIIDLKSGYVQRGIAEFPFVTTAEPYALHNNHFRESQAFRSCDLSGLDFGVTQLAGVRARVTGPKDGDTVVLLHGIGRSLEDYDVLDFPGKRVIALDIPGFGATAGLPEPTMAGIATALWDAIDASGAGAPVTLVGNSLGGALAMRMSLTRPEQVKRVVLLAPSGFSEDITSSVKIAASPLGKAFLKLAAGPLLEKVERKVVSDPALVTRERVSVATRNALGPDHARTFIALSRELAAVPAGHRMDTARAFGALGIPTHVVWGEKDNILSVAHLDAVRETIPHGQITQLSEVGHILQRECPELVCAAVANDVVS